VYVPVDIGYGILVSNGAPRLIKEKVTSFRSSLGDGVDAWYQFSFVIGLRSIFSWLHHGGAKWQVEDLAECLNRCQSELFQSHG
jgi:hypothetical protein